LGGGVFRGCAGDVVNEVVVVGVGQFLWFAVFDLWQDEGCEAGGL